MKQLADLIDFHSRLDVVDQASAPTAFTDLFQEGYKLLDLDDAEASALLGTSLPNICRWNSGKVVPPAADMVLRFLKEEVQRRIGLLQPSKVA